MESKCVDILVEFPIEGPKELDVVRVLKTLAALARKSIFLLVDDPMKDVERVIGDTPFDYFLFKKTQTTKVHCRNALSSVKHITQVLDGAI